jgi:hypothetical protein
MLKFNKTILFLIILIFLLSFNKVYAVSGEVLGIHILSPHEIEKAKDLVAPENKDQWHYVTIPLAFDDLNKESEWQEFFEKTKKYRIIPIIRLATRVENSSWLVPNRREITRYFEFLDQFEWPTDKRFIIVFNEVNHAKEWGGWVSPTSYLEVLKFTSNWARSENKNYIVLPAAMDLAAPNGKATIEAFNFLNQLYSLDNEIFDYVDYWNSHSYPNPGFSSSPQRTTQNSLRGFLHELDFLKAKTGKDYRVFITETGWQSNRYTNRYLTPYYTYAMQHIWSHPQVEGVTPFLLKGSPGPFTGFSFLTADDKPTAAYEALQEAIKKTYTQ